MCYLSPFLPLSLSPSLPPSHFPSHPLSHLPPSHPSSLPLPAGVMGADPIKENSIRVIDLGGNRGARGLASNGVQGGSLVDQVGKNRCSGRQTDLLAGQLSVPLSAGSFGGSHSIRPLISAESTITAF